jgi:hypothetical protein
MQLPLLMMPTDDRWAFPADSRFGLAEDWLPVPISHEARRETLTLRYLRRSVRRPPATCSSGPDLQGMKPVLEALRPVGHLSRRAGADTVRSADAPRPPEETPAPPRFLPEFDNLLLSHGDRTRVLPDEFVTTFWGRRMVASRPRFWSMAWVREPGE